MKQGQENPEVWSGPSGCSVKPIGGLKFYLEQPTRLFHAPRFSHIWPRCQSSFVDFSPPPCRDRPTVEAAAWKPATVAPGCCSSDLAVWRAETRSAGERQESISCLLTIWTSRVAPGPPQPQMPHSTQPEKSGSSSRCRQRPTSAGDQPVRNAYRFPDSSSER